MKLLRKTSHSGWFFVEELPDGSEGRVIFAQGQPVPIELAEEIAEELSAWRWPLGLDIGVDVGVSAGAHEMADANGWHDIPELQMAGQRQAVEWPTEDDHDPTRVMGGVYNPANTTDVVEP